MAFVLKSQEFREFLKERIDPLVEDEDVRKILVAGLWGKEKPFIHSHLENIASEVLGTPEKPWDELRRAAIMRKLREHPKIEEVEEFRRRKRGWPEGLEETVERALKDIGVEEEELRDAAVDLLLKKVFLPWATEQANWEDRSPQGRVVSFVMRELARFTLRRAEQDPEVKRLLEERNVKEAVFRALGTGGGASKRFLVRLERTLYSFNPRLSPGLGKEEWRRLLALLREERVGKGTTVEQIARTLKNFVASGYKHPEEARLPSLLTHLSWDQLVEVLSLLTGDPKEAVEEKLEKMTLRKIWE